MLTTLLARLGILFVNSDDIARRLAADLLHLWRHDLHQLGEATGKQELQRHYMEIAMATGLPGGIARQVADRAWHYVAQAQRTPVAQRKGFSFYG